MLLLAVVNHVYMVSILLTRNCHHIQAEKYQQLDEQNMTYFVFEKPKLFKNSSCQRGVKIQASKGATSSLAKGFQSAPRRPKARG